MDIFEANRLGKSLLVLHGLDVRGWKFVMDYSVKRFGVCKHGSRIISVSIPLTQLNGEAEVKDVILHEIAHALVDGKHGHDDVWKAMCVKIGAKPERCYSTDTVIQPDMRYKATCGGCGKVNQMTRKPDRLAQYWCLCQSRVKTKDKIFLKYIDTKLASVGN